MALDLANIINSSIDLAQELGLTVACTHEARSSSSANGYRQPSYAGATTFQAIWEPRAERRVDAQGVEYISRGFIVLKSTPVIGRDDRITLPDGTKPTIRDVQAYRATSGIIAQQVVF